MKHIASIEDLRQRARRRVPKMFYDYVDGGAWTETTFRANSSDFAKILLRPRVAVDVAARTARATIAGEPARLPLAVAPTGLTGVYWPDREKLALRACEAFGVPFTLSTMSIASLEDLANVATRPFWFQPYVSKDRDFTSRLVDRADAVGIKTLMLTLDLQMVGQRNKDIHNGLSSPPKPTLRNLMNFAHKPAWCLAMARVRKMQFGNLYGHVPQIKNAKSLSRWTNEQLDQSLNWDDVRAFRDRWKGRLILKGIMDPEDAEQAVACGADAIVVSNHGGRQLDGAPSTISVLPGIVEAVGERIEVLLDSGILSGQDVFKALAMGARGVLIGRAMLYGLRAAGEQGVAKCLAIIAHELETTMGLCGVSKVGDIARNNLTGQSGCSAQSQSR